GTYWNNKKHEGHAYDPQHPCMLKRGEFAIHVPGCSLMEQRKMKQYAKTATQGAKKILVCKMRDWPELVGFHDNKSPHQAMAGGMIEL
ncbi:MAG: hypothetical protein MUO63_11735, partial [Desulfobulbaceae bacterium]|nr:hypothetical protein [Desulfobulbaceae bacterium]